MIKRYCDRCGQQIDEGVHAWYVLELHGTDGEFRHKELCEECYEYLCEKDEAPKADRKDEPQTDCNGCQHYVEATADACYECKRSYADCYEPQTDTEIAKAIVHKMIDDAVIAEDAYPDLRQKMHDAVDEYKSQTDCPWK